MPAWPSQLLMIRPIVIAVMMVVVVVMMMFAVMVPRRVVGAVLCHS